MRLGEYSKWYHILHAQLLWWYLIIKYLVHYGFPTAVAFLSEAVIPYAVALSHEGAFSTNMQLIFTALRKCRSWPCRYFCISNFIYLNKCIAHIALQIPNSFHPELESGLSVNILAREGWHLTELPVLKLKTHPELIPVAHTVQNASYDGQQTQWNL